MTRTACVAQSPCCLPLNPGFALCREVRTYTDLLKKINELDPRVVLMDLHMSDESHFDGNYIKGQLRRSRLLAMSVWKDDMTVRLAHSYGAIKLLDKSNLVSTLMPAVEECIHEERRARPA